MAKAGLIVTFGSLLIAAVIFQSAIGWTENDLNPTPLWPDNVATMPDADFSKLITKLQPLVPKAIAGQPYSIKPGDAPGTYAVTWGSQSMVWKPQPWMESNYARRS